MIMFLSGMAAGAALLTGLFKVRCVRWDRMERNQKRRAERAKRRQQERKGFCGDVSKNNDWMQETMRL
jgi:hypothetical protein